jgi:hypothetical protein
MTTAIDHAQIDQRVQVGKETVRGTAVAALVSLPTAKIMVKGEGTNKDIFPSGAMFPSASRPGKRSGSGTYEADASYTEMLIFLDAFWGHQAGATLGTGKRYTWTAPRRGVPVPTPLTVQEGDTVRAKQMAGVVPTSWKWKTDDEDVALSGDLIGSYPDREAALSTNTRFHSALAGTDATTTFTYSTANALGAAGPTAPITLASTDQSAAIQAALEALSTIGVGNVRVTKTATHAYDIELIGALAQTSYATADFTGAASLGSSPANTITRTQTGAAATEMALVLLNPNDVENILAFAYADLGTNTPLPRSAELTFDVTDLRAPFYMMGNNSAGYTGIVGKRPGANITLTLGADNEGLDLLDNVALGTTLWLRQQYISDIEFDAGHPYAFTQTWALQCSKVPDDTDKDELALLKYEFVPVWDSVNGFSYTAILDTDATF